MRISALILITIILASCSTSIEYVRIPGTFDGWKVGHQYINHRSADASNIREFIPHNEKIDNWSKIITIQYMDGIKIEPESMMLNLEKDMKKRCQQTKWEVIKRFKTSILYEWSIKDCPPESDQHEISRLFLGKEGAHRVSYTEKTQIIEPTTRNKWIEKLSTSRVEKDGVEIHGL